MIAVHNASHGSLNDLCECLLNALGIETNAVKVVEKGFEEALRQTGPKEKVYAITFLGLNLAGKSTSIKLICGTRSNV